MANPTTPKQAEKDFPTPQDFASFLNQHWKNKRLTAKKIGKDNLVGNTIGDQWLNWYLAVAPNNPKYSLGDLEIVFFDFAVAQALLGALAQAEGATGQVTEKIAQGTASGLNQTAKNLHVSNPLAGLAAIGDFFGRLGQANTWIRVAEVLLGAGLIIVGLAKLAAGTPIGQAALKAGKAAALL